MRTEVSVIVPIYNVERYLAKCVDSILAQTYGDFELILIDDGSPDRCGEIIDSYAVKDNRVVPIHQKNMGVSAARNAGLRVAKGDFLSFIDPDDFVSTDFLEVLVNEITKYDADIACCGCDSYDKNGNIKRMNSLPSGVMSRDEWIGHIFDIPRTIKSTNWNKLFRRECISVQYNTMYRICEDRLFLVQNSLHIQKAVYIDMPLYHLFERPDSATRADPSRQLEGLSAEKQILGIMKQEGGELYALSEADYLDTSLRLYNEFRTIAPDRAEIERSAYKCYMHHHLIHFLTNRKISIKQKVMYLIK